MKTVVSSVLVMTCRLMSGKAHFARREWLWRTSRTESRLLLRGRGRVKCLGAWRSAMVIAGCVNES